MQFATLQDITVGDEVFVVRHAVQLCRLDVDMLLAVVVGTDHKLPSVVEPDGHLFKEGTAKDILVRARADTVDAHGTEHIPGGHLSLIFVAGIAPFGRIVQPGGDHPAIFLCLPGLPAEIIEVRHVLGRLVAMRILPHLGQQHLAHLMDLLFVGSIVDALLHCEEGIQLGIEALGAPRAD